MKEIIYFRESMIQSMVADFFTFFFLTLMFAFNHFYMADSKVTAFVFFVVFLLFTLSKASARKRTFTDKEELKKYVSNL